MTKEKVFDDFYGKGMRHRVRMIINDLAPVTRRDAWWSTDGPYDIIATHLMKPHPDADGQNVVGCDRERT